MWHGWQVAALNSINLCFIRSEQLNSVLSRTNYSRLLNTFYGCPSFRHFRVPSFFQCLPFILSF